MCELFAMSTLYPANVRFSLEAFARHGELEGPHKDGWGIAYYAGEDVRKSCQPFARELGGRMHVFTRAAGR